MTDNQQRTIIIAEAGVNHGGNIDTAFKLIRAAADCGADYVKFQTFRADRLVCRDARRARYQEENCGGNESQFEMLRRLELGPEAFAMLRDECRRCGIGFLSSPFDLESIDLLAGLGMDYWKIPSGEITNLPYLERIASKGGRIILSTGMSTLSEVARAMEVFTSAGIPAADITILQCNTQYPTPVADVNLRAMEALRTLHPGAVGFSDHTAGIAVPVAAVALGASMIEKHFTLDRHAAGPDHIASADTAEFAAMVASIRQVELALGRPVKEVTDSERPNLTVARKSIVAARPISRGQIITEADIEAKRPGGGLSPMLWHTVVGSVASADFLPDEPIKL